jgi:hypothetical protein
METAADTDGGQGRLDSQGSPKVGRDRDASVAGSVAPTGHFRYSASRDATRVSVAASGPVRAGRRILSERSPAVEGAFIGHT